MDLKLTGKTAFISGSTQGIDFAIAKKLLEEGANVIINGRTVDKLNQAIERLKTGFDDEDKISGIAADFSKAEEVNQLIETLPDVDILVNNAGIFGPKPFEEISDDE